MAEILSLEQFASQLAEYWCLEINESDVEQPLGDIGVDSLGKLELIIMLEDFAGHEVPDEVWLETMTIRDIYGCYEVYASRDRAGVEFFDAN